MLSQHTSVLSLAFTLLYIINLFPHKVQFQSRSALRAVPRRLAMDENNRGASGINRFENDLCRFILAGCCISVHYFSAAHHKRTGNRMDDRNRRLCTPQRWQRRASRNWQKTDTSSESAALSPLLSIFSWVFIKHRTLPTAGGPPIRLTALMSKCSTGKQLYCYCTVRLFFFFVLAHTMKPRKGFKNGLTGIVTEKLWN